MTEPRLGRTSMLSSFCSVLSLLPHAQMLCTVCIFSVIVQCIAYHKSKNSSKNVRTWSMSRDVVTTGAFAVALAARWALVAKSGVSTADLVHSREEVILAHMPA
ncbi:hypothetical protein C8Q76DRAFT_734131 [Earliella scabrosa]|nr:hypothetical protein C8Q76DRAFT_734131 [Earliella scabrosa]